MSKKILLILFCAFIGNAGFAKSRISYTFEIEPIYTYRNYKLSDYQKETEFYPSGKIIYESFKKYYNETEKAGIGFGLTLGINYKLTEKITFKSGIGFKYNREKIKLTMPAGRYESDGQIFPVYSKNNEAIKIFNNYQYLTIPIEFQHKIFALKKWVIGLSIGSDIDFLINSEIKNHFDDLQTDLKYKYGKTTKVAGNLKSGLIFEYKFQDNMSIYLQPEFAKYITPNVKYNIQLENLSWCKINQYNYYGLIKFGLKFNK